MKSSAQMQRSKRHIIFHKMFFLLEVIQSVFCCVSVEVSIALNLLLLFDYLV